MLEAQVQKWISPYTASGVPLSVVLPSGRRIEPIAPVRVEMRLRDSGALRHLLRPTLASLGTAYVEGLIDLEGEVDDILAVAIRLSKGSGEAFVDGSQSFLDRLRTHGRDRDRLAVQYHYDVSNEFYALFLDAHMVYSCAYFRSEGDTLEQAQQQKLDHILNKLRLRPGESFLDVGAGWGALLVRAAQRGARAVGITLSEHQYEYVRGLIDRLGLGERCTIRLQDYRDVPQGEQYDKIASVGMFEHVGHRNLPMYFDKLHQLLTPGGAMLIHGITATLPGGKQVGRGGGDFIGRYVFPDGELPHLSFVLQNISTAGFETVDCESLRRHYAKTLTHWARRLEQHADRARELAGDKRFRIWRVYLAGCAYGFAHNWMNIYQVLACKLGGPGVNPLPETRDWMYRN